MILKTDKPGRAGLNFKYFKNEDNGEDITLVRLYGTIIVLSEAGYIRLNTDGHNTRHTKNCMNDFLPNGYTIFQEDFEWYVSTPKGDLIFTDNMKIEVA